MNIQLKLLLSCILLLFSSFAGVATNLPGECKFHNNGILLDCSNLNTVPKGPFENVEIVNFSDNNFTQLTQYFLHNQGFRNLKIAILRHDNISKIKPKAFSRMSSLTQLDLYGNKISNLSSTTFTGLTSLKTLNLGNNQLLAIEAAMFRPLKFLHKLDLSNNSLKYLPENLLSNGYVTHLDVSENSLNFPQGPILSSLSLLQLILRSCNLQKLPAGAFGSLPGLQELDLSKNKLKAIPEGLFKSLLDLKYLDISYNLIGYLEMDEFSSLTQLRELKCEGNPLQFSQVCVYLTTGSTEKPTLQNYTKRHEDIDGKIGLNSTIDQKSPTRPPNAQDTEASEEYESEASLKLIYFILVAVLISTIVLLLMICAFCYHYFRHVRADNAFAGHEYEKIARNNNCSNLLLNLSTRSDIFDC